MVQSACRVGMMVCAVAVVAVSGCGGRARPFQLETSTGKPEVVVKASMKSVATYLTSEMLTGDYMLKSQNPNVIVFNKFTTYQVDYQDVPGEYRVTCNLVQAPGGVRVMMTMFGVMRPDSAYERITNDYSKEYDAASSYQIVLNQMKYRLETENPGKLGAKLSGYYGDKIESVEAEGPAAAAGLAPGDVVLTVDGAAVSDDPVANYALICHHRAGTTHQLVVQRKKDVTETVSVTYAPVGEIPGKSPASAVASMPADAVVNIESIGAAIRGATIVSVTADGPAEKAGLQADDAITTIDGEPAGDDGALNARKLAGRTNTSVVVTVRRGEEEVTAAVIRKNP
jgi:C-terminal processing protease CtpA/Prc